MNEVHTFFNSLTGQDNVFYTITASPFFSLTLCFFTYSLGLFIQSKTKSAIFNPLLIATILCIAVLQVFDIPHKHFTNGGNLINMMLAPVTTILAVSMYNQREMLRKYIAPAIIGTLVGSIASITSVFFLIKLFGLDTSLFDSLFAKSVTTPISFALTTERGGNTSIAMAGIIIAGISGAVLSPYYIKIFRVKNPIAAGLAVGTASHALGTARALQIGELEGAMSSIAIGLAGLATVFISLFI